MGQDARKGLELVKLRLAMQDFTSKTIMMDLREVGSKKAICKSEDLGRSIDAFAGGRAAVKGTLKKLIRVVTADGEPAEQLGFRLAKESGVSPGPGVPTGWKRVAVLSCTMSIALMSTILVLVFRWSTI